MALRRMSLTDRAWALCVPSLPRPWVWPRWIQSAALARAAEALTLAEDLEQDGADGVALPPVAGELSLQAGQQVGGQPRTPYIEAVTSRFATAFTRWPARG